MSETFLLVEPVLVMPLLPEEQEALRQHGCTVKVYPNKRLRLGHMITFPDGARMDMVSRNYSKLLFPDGFHSLLIWNGRAYHFYPVEAL